MIDLEALGSDEVMANLWGCSTRWVRQLKKDGVIDSVGENLYNICESNQKYIASKSKSVTKTADGEVICFNTERARKTKEEADRLARENKLADNEVLDQEEYGALITEALLVQKRELESMELQLSHLLPGMSNSVRDEIKRISARCHNAVLDLQIDQESDELAKA